MIIKPRNVAYVAIYFILYCRAFANPCSLAAVNFFLGCVGVVQCSRIFLHHRSQKGSSAEAAKEMEHEVVDPAKKLGKEAEAAVEKK